MMKALRFGLLLAAVCASALSFAGSTQAQLIMKGARFTLPFEANLDGRVLPAGDYTLFVGRIHTGRDLVYRVTLSGAGKTSELLAVESLGSDAGERCELTTGLSGQTHVIRELHLPGAGLVLKFREPKAQKALNADRHTPEQNVPILVAEK